MFPYVLTLFSAAAILLTAFFAIRYREVRAYVRLLALFLAAAFVLFLYFHYGDTTQLYGLGILAVATLFPLTDIWKSHSKEK